MSEEQPRKKLSLGRKTLKTARTTSIGNNLKSKIHAKKEDSVNNFFKNADGDIVKLYEERKGVVEQIKQLEQRLLFAKSEPLQEFLFELKTRDFELLAEINSKLV